MNDLMNENFVRTQVEVNSWQEAIHEGVELLVEANYVTKSYEEAILASFQEHGVYMVISPGVVLSHAKPGDYVKKSGISLINLKEPVAFGHQMNDPVHLVITLAAKDSTSHLEGLRKMTTILMDNHSLECLKFAKDKQVIIDLLLN